MEAGIFELRKKPSLIFELGKEGFNLFDAENKSISGFYKYSTLESIHVVASKINWRVTLLSYLLSLVAHIEAADEYKDKEILVLKLKSTTIELILEGVEKHKVEVLTAQLDSLIKH